MSAKPRDHRPKVISFRTALDGLNIAAKQSVLWPCHAFNISIPQKKNSSLNVFEETVLKITEIESGDTKNIALLTCLEKEFVAFIQNRLNHVGLFTDRYELSEEGKQLLNSWRNKDEECIEYVAGTIFVDLVLGKVLPYIHVGKLRYDKILSIDNEFINIESGSVGNSRQQKCRLIRKSENSDRKKVPDSSDIVRAVRAYKKKYKRYALLSQSVDHYPPSVPMAEVISIHESPELVYLYCDALIQTGNSELLVTDGCGFGFSEGFSSYLNLQDYQWVIKLKQKGIVEKVANTEYTENQPSKRNYKYAEISKRIQNSKKQLQTIRELEVNGTNYERDYRQKIENGIKSLYEALEWTLRQVVAENRNNEWEHFLSASNFRMTEILIEFAKKIGFTVSEKNQNLLQVNPGAIRQIDHGKVELQPLLALAIIGANSNTNHAIHRLAQNHSGFLTHALRLKKYRDPIAHGSTEKLDLDEGILEELIETTVPMITSLMPDVEEDLGEFENLSNDRDINQKRLKANIALEKALGTAFVSSLSGDIKEQLIRSELMLAKFSTEKTIEIINCYASVVQQSLLDAIKDRKLESASDSIRETAIEKIIQSGFFLTKGQIPKNISTVALHNVSRAAQGISTTLGAQLLAVFLLGTESELLELQKSDPKFVNFVSNLIQLRGHGNQNLSDISQEQIESIKDNTLQQNVLNTIKIITEVF